MTLKASIPSQLNKKMSGSLTHELEVNVPASKAWELYGTLELSKLVAEKLPQIITSIEVVQGDGGVGTVLKLVFAPGAPFAHYNEKFTVVDNEKRVKETEVVEGGILDMGFSLYRVRLQMLEKGSETCIIKSTIEYQAKEEAASIASSVVTIQPLVAIAQIAKQYLTQNT